MCLTVFLLGFILYGTLCASWTWLAILFPMWGEFSTIISSSIFSDPFFLFLFFWDPCPACSRCFPPPAHLRDPCPACSHTACLVLASCSVVLWGTCEKTTCLCLEHTNIVMQRCGRETEREGKTKHKHPNKDSMPFLSCMSALHCSLTSAMQVMLQMR